LCRDVLHANSNSIKKNKTIKAPSQSTRKGKPKQHSIPIPNSQGPRTSPCHCRICHCTTRRLDALHRHPSSLNRSPHYPNLRTPLHLAPKARVLNHYPPASLPAHSTAQHNSVHKNAPTPLYLDVYAHTCVCCTHPHTFQNPPTTARAQHTTYPPPKTLVPRLGTQSRTHARGEQSLRHRTRKHEHEQSVPTARRASMAPSASRRGIREAVTHAR
jgi:hypothetical protein